MSKVAVGMSGGVDSSVAAAILTKEGYDVTGVFMECWPSSAEASAGKNVPCRAEQDKRDALKVALKLGIPFEVLDYKKEYKEKVVQYFYDTYESGLTPNPDVVCNQEVKFGLFYKWAKENGFSYIATGHYARIKNDGERVFLQRASDQQKDQSYFLHRISEEQLKFALFPLGEMLKKDVRKMAQDNNIHVSDKPDSMGICFMGEIDVEELLAKELGDNPGEVIYKGSVVGGHKGLWFHTIGQRGGLDIDKKKLVNLGINPSSMKPFYVVGKILEKNQVVVGYKDEAYRNRFVLNDFHWINGEKIAENIIEGGGKLMVRIRNLGEILECEVDKVKNGLNVKTNKPFFGVAEGQSGVLYFRDGAEGDELVLGGGIISY